MSSKETPRPVEPIVASVDAYLDREHPEPGFDRAAFLRMVLGGVGAGVGLGLLAACGGGASDSSSAAGAATQAQTGAAASSGGSLSGLQYSFFMDKPQYASFESEYGYAPTWTVYNPPPTTQIPKIQQRPSQWDVCVLPSSASGFFMDADILQPWDTAQIPNYATIFPKFIEIDNSRTNDQPYEIPILWGHNSISYASDALSEADASTIEVLFDEAFKGRIAMQNQAQESFAVAGLYLGFSDPYRMTEDEYEQAKELLIKQKPLVRAYWSQVGDLATLFANGEVVVAWSWPVVPSLVAEQSGPSTAFVPFLEQGGTGWDSGLGLTKEAKNVTEAHAYANWALSEPNIKWMAEKNNYASVSETANTVLTPEQVELYGLDDPDATLAKLAFQDYYYEADKVQKMWEEVQVA